MNGSWICGAQMTAIRVSMPGVSTRTNVDEKRNSKRIKTPILLLDHSVLSCYHRFFLMQDVLKFLNVLVMPLSLAFSNRLKYINCLFHV